MESFDDILKVPFSPVCYTIEEETVNREQGGRFFCQNLLNILKRSLGTICPE